MEVERELSESTVFYGNGNVFADLGMSDAEEMLAKAKLVSAIQDTIDGRELSLKQAADLMGVREANLLTLIRGGLTEFSTERLLSFLIQLGLDVDVVVHKSTTASSNRPGEFNVAYI